MSGDGLANPSPADTPDRDAQYTTELAYTNNVAQAAYEAFLQGQFGVNTPAEGAADGYPSVQVLPQVTYRVAAQLAVSFATAAQAQAFAASGAAAQALLQAARQLCPQLAATLLLSGNISVPSGGAAAAALVPLAAAVSPAPEAANASACVASLTVPDGSALPRLLSLSPQPANWGALANATSAAFASGPTVQARYAIVLDSLASQIPIGDLMGAVTPGVVRNDLSAALQRSALRCLPCSAHTRRCSRSLACPAFC